MFLQLGTNEIIFLVWLDMVGLDVGECLGRKCRILIPWKRVQDKNKQRTMREEISPVGRMALGNARTKAGERRDARDPRGEVSRDRLLPPLAQNYSSLQLKDS